DTAKNDGSDEQGTAFGLHHQLAMIPQYSVDSSGPFANAKHARSQLRVFGQELLIETHDSLVLADRPAFQSFHDGTEKFLAFSVVARINKRRSPIAANVKHGREIASRSD